MQDEQKKFDLKTRLTWILFYPETAAATAIKGCRPELREPGIIGSRKHPIGSNSYEIGPKTALIGSLTRKIGSMLCHSQL
jgi:hypothetical protein